MNENLSINQVEKMTGVSKRNIRFYEKEGLLLPKRNEENGYKKAKIIKQGSFSQEFGGGVCQVSTTLYNCALLADLEIVEVNPHSLPVSYVEPSFDAMVNTGSSDLKIKNNTDKPIYIATSGDDEFCKICMFGCENPYKIIKKSTLG